MGNNCCTCVNRKDIAKKKQDVDFTTQKLQMEAVDGNALNNDDLAGDYENKYIEVDSPISKTNRQDQNKKNKKFRLAKVALSNSTTRNKILTAKIYSTNKISKMCDRDELYSAYLEGDYVLKLIEVYDQPKVHIYEDYKGGTLSDLIFKTFNCYLY